MSTGLRSIGEILAETEIGKELARRLARERLAALLDEYSTAMTTRDMETVHGLQGELEQLVGEGAG